MSKTVTINEGSYTIRETRSDTPSAAGSWIREFRIIHNYASTRIYGDNVSHWRKRIRANESATSSLETARRIVDADNTGHLTATLVGANFNPGNFPNWVKRSVRGCISMNDDVPPTDPVFVTFPTTSVQNQAKQRFISQIIDAQSALRGLVTLGEAGETLRMVNSRSRTLSSSFHSYLGDVKKQLPRRRTKIDKIRRLADLYLEYQFGWKPLVSDINDGAKALSRIFTYKLPSIRVSGSAEYSKLVSSVKSSQSYTTFTVHRTTSVYEVYSYRLHGEVALPAKANNLAMIADELGLNFSQFVPTLWELIPYSFIVDYFSNVGAIIDGYFANTSLLRWAESGELKRTEKRFSRVGVTTNTVSPGIRLSEAIYQPDRGSSYTFERKKRTNVTGNSFTPSLEFEIPGISTKWLNLAALLASSREVSKRVRSF